MGCPLEAARACEAQVGAERVAHRVGEPFGAARREAVLPPDVEHLHAGVGPVDARLDPADESVPERDRQHVPAPAALGGRYEELPHVVEAEKAAKQAAVPDQRIERLLPADIVACEIPLIEQLRYKLLSRHRAHGLLGASPGSDILSGLGPAKPDPRWPDYPGRNALRDELVERGEIVPVDVEGVRGKRFVIPEDVELLEAPPEPPPSVAFLPPFDALVWDRVLLGSLFGFDYVWELFVPPAKRRWGWYVLPILFAGRFVGRIEPRIDSTESRVPVLDVGWEDGFAPRRSEGFVEAMRDALRAYLRFAGAGRLEWASHLRAEKRVLSLSRSA